ncbi:MAG: sulfotransferase [Verrucomicrobiales bacterium]
MNHVFENIRKNHSLRSNMELLLKVYTAMPSALKRSMTSTYIGLRKLKEARLSRKLSNLPHQPFPDGRPRVCYMSGFPRSGTTMLKYYFGTHPGLVQTSFTTKGFFSAWEKAEELASGNEILIDKSNHYIYSLENIFRAYGDAVKACIVVRDPRDSLVSFANYQENREVPRDSSYWSYWARQHRGLIDFAKRSPLGKNLFVIRYEELVRYPEHAKAAFLTWLGIPTAPESINREYVNQNPGEGWDDSVHKRRDVSDYAIQKWTKMGQLPDTLTSVLGSWQENSEAREMMRLFGYHETGFTRPALSGEEFVFYRPDDAEMPFSKSCSPALDAATASV